MFGLINCVLFVFYVVIENVVVLGRFCVVWFDGGGGGGFLSFVNLVIFLLLKFVLFMIEFNDLFGFIFVFFNCLVIFWVLFLVKLFVL